MTTWPSPSNCNWSGARTACGLLSELLHEAHAAGRVVALTSDHGHVLEEDGVKLPGDLEGRWRAAGRPPADLEIELAGERVRAATTAAPGSSSPGAKPCATPSARTAITAA